MVEKILVKLNNDNLERYERKANFKVLYIYGL